MNRDPITFLLLDCNMFECAKWDDLLIPEHVSSMRNENHQFPYTLVAGLQTMKQTMKIPAGIPLSVALTNLCVITIIQEETLRGHDDCPCSKPADREAAGRLDALNAAIEFLQVIGMIILHPIDVIRYLRREGAIARTNAPRRRVD